MRKGLLFIALMISSASLFAGGAKNLKFNEVLVNNTESYVDEYGKHTAWIELHNDAFAQADARACYLTNNPAVLNEKMSVPERVALMYWIPKGDVSTKISGKQKLVFFADGFPNKGVFHTNFTLNDSTSNWIALYDADGFTLLDSLTIPALGVNQSYAMDEDASGHWVIKTADKVTPNASNGTEITENKVAKFKRLDHTGVGMAIMAMTVVFSVLLILYILFRLIGSFYKVSDKKQANKTARPATTEKVAITSTNEEGEIAAAIALALHQYQSNIHDEESDIVTIDPADSSWNMLTHTHIH